MARHSTTASPRVPGAGNEALPLFEEPDGTWLLDCRGMLCPIPVIKASQAIRQLPMESLLVVRADDPGAELDLVDWAQANRHQHLGVRVEGAETWTTLRKRR